MPFINERFKFSLFLPKGWKSTLSILNLHPTSRQSSGKITKICDRVFLAIGIPPSPDILRIISHTWKRRLLWGFSTILGLSFPIGGYKLRRHLATWHILYRFGRALSPVPTKLSFCQCASVLTTLQCLCDNCDRNPCSRSQMDLGYETSRKKIWVGRVDSPFLFSPLNPITVVPIRHRTAVNQNQ
jgi:hypothetical protein